MSDDFLLHYASHILRLLFKHGISPCSATLHECQMNQMPSRS